MTLEIRPVTSAEDRLTVLRVAYSAAHDYGDPSPFEQYAGRRLSSARRKYAAWWLAELGGEPVA